MFKEDGLKPLAAVFNIKAADYRKVLIADLPFKNQVTRSLTSKRIRTLAQLLEFSADDLALTAGLSANGINQILDYLKLVTSNSPNDFSAVLQYNKEKSKIAPANDAFSKLLQDAKYSLLRDALDKVGISDIEGLKSLNLWCFMNSHSLYTIQQRLAISNELADKLKNLDKPVTVKPEITYEILYGDAVYSGDTPPEAFVEFLPAIAVKYPLKLRGLVSAINPETSKIVLRKHNYNNDKLKLQNPEVYIDPDLTLNQVNTYISWIIARCDAVPAEFAVQEVRHNVEKPIQGEVPEIPDEQPETVYADEESSQNDETPVNEEAENLTIDVPDDGTDTEEPADVPVHIAKVFPTPAPYFTQKAEEYLSNCESGAFYDELQGVLNHTMVGTKEAVALSPHIIELNHRLYHEENFSYFEEGADTIEGILEKLLKKNNGIASATQLYEYAHSDMSMFLNINGIIDQQAVYDLARHLFEKLEYHGKYYYFHSNMYISLPEVAAQSNLDIMKKYAREKGTTVTFDEMGKYLKGLSLNNGNLRGVMRIDKEPVFLIYRENEYLLAELLQIDDYFLGKIKQALKHLFLDGNEYVIISSIADSWFTLLPALPARLEWTPMLLQQILHFYSKELGARTIIAMDSQGSNTLHAAIVSNDSWIRDFRDVVALFLHNEMPERKSFDAEELRKILVQAGMIFGNQLIWHMHIALGGDPRFLWDGDGNSVKVRL